MTQARFEEIREHILAFLSDKCLSEDMVTEHYHTRGLSLKRARWDTLHASGYPTAPLYKEDGLNDAHVDTALRKILHH